MTQRTSTPNRLNLACAAIALSLALACIGFANAAEAIAQEPDLQTDVQTIGAQASSTYKLISARFDESYDYEKGMKYPPLGISYRHPNSSSSGFFFVEDLDGTDVTKENSPWGPTLKISFAGGKVTVKGVDNCSGTITLKAVKAKPKPSASVFRPWKKGIATESSFDDYDGTGKVYSNNVKKIKASTLKKKNVTFKLPNPVNKAKLKWSFVKVNLSGEYHQELDADGVYKNFPRNISINTKSRKVTIKKGNYEKKSYYIPVGIKTKATGKYQTAYYGPDSGHPSLSNYIYMLRIV